MSVKILNKNLSVDWHNSRKKTSLNFKDHRTLQVLSLAPFNPVDNLQWLCWLPIEYHAN